MLGGVGGVPGNRAPISITMVRRSCGEMPLAIKTDVDETHQAHLAQSNSHYGWKTVNDPVAINAIP